MKSCRIRLKSSLLFGLLLTTASYADSEAAKDKHFRYAVHDAVPWITRDNDSFAGVVPYYAERFEKASGYRFELHAMPYQRSLNSIERDDIDFVISLNHPELQKKARPVIQLGRIAAMLFSSKPLDPLLETNEPKKVAASALRGVLPVVEEMLPAWSFMETNSEKSSLLAAQRDFLDVAIISRNLYDYMLAQGVDLDNGEYHTRDIGFFPVYGWLRNDREMTPELEALKQKILENNLNGLLVFDWKSTQSIQQSDDTSLDLDDEDE